MWLPFCCIGLMSLFLFRRSSFLSFCVPSGCSCRVGLSMQCFHRPLRSIFSLLIASSFPFLGATNRSLFAKAVDKTPELAAFKGTMQALLSMSSSVAGFTAPALVTHFCLRSSIEVETSHDSREFTPLTLLCPLIR